MSQNFQIATPKERHSPEVMERIESTELAEGAPKWASCSSLRKVVVDICRLAFVSGF